MIDLAPFVKTLDNKPIGVFGLGVSGQATVEALKSAGANIIAWDDQTGTPPQNYEDLAALILSPGVPLHFPEPHPVVIVARAAGIQIISDIEILGLCLQGRKTIGITGTNGKSTTAALLQHVLVECGVDSVLGGNIGRAALSLDMPSEEGVFVLELSSYQLDLCPTFTPDIAVLLNVTQDHIDRHGTMENYVASKSQIFEGDGHAIIATDDGYTRRIADDVSTKGARTLHRVSSKDMSLETRTLKGAHNQQNIAVVTQVTTLLGLNETQVFKAIESFPGLPHRQFLVREMDGVSFVNDSKATNVEATAKALNAFDNIYWIVGGQAKEGGLKGLEPYADKIKHAFLIGEAADDFEPWIIANNIRSTNCKTLETASKAASDLAAQNGRGTVLLSPACASWDQFKSFEERGAAFEDAVHSL